MDETILKNLTEKVDKLFEEFDIKKINKNYEKQKNTTIMIYTNYTTYTTPISVYYNNIEIRRVPRFKLGYGVIGRAFPKLGIIEIADDLYGYDFEEVKIHEMLHIKHPEKTEYEIRHLTKMLLPFKPKWH